MPHPALSTAALSRLGLRVPQHLLTEWDGMFDVADPRVQLCNHMSDARGELLRNEIRIHDRACWVAYSSSIQEWTQELVCDATALGYGVMAHESQMRFFGEIVSAFPEHFAGRVLDVGSLDINGGPHTLFRSVEYVGVDLGPGPNVTYVGRGEELTLPDGWFDVTMSSECFEHNPHWRATLGNMIRMTRSGGLVIFTAASTGRAEHGTTRSDQGYAAPLAVATGQEWYRNLRTRDVVKVVSGTEMARWFCVELRSTSDLLFAGIVGGAENADSLALRELYARWRVTSRESRYPGRWVRRAILRATGDRGLRVVEKVRHRLN